MRLYCSFHKSGALALKFKRLAKFMIGFYGNLTNQSSYMANTKKMKAIFFFALLLSAVSAWSQVEKPVDSKITDVTVFLNKAQVTREVKTRLDAGKTNLYLSGLTSMLDPQSIQVTGKGNLVILGRPLRGRLPARHPHRTRQRK